MDAALIRSVRSSLALAGLVFVVGCSHQATPGPMAESGAGRNTPAVSNDDDVQLSHVSAGAAQPGQEQFDSPEQAAAMLKDGVQTEDRRLLIRLFGAEGKQLVLSGDRVQESNDMQAFAKLLSEQLRVEHESAGKAVLYIGSQNWPFPIPVVKSGDKWFFDTAAGKDELLNRRIGENELAAIAVCRAYVRAQNEYAQKNPTGDGVTQYAQHFMSTSGKKDGLYWPAGPGEDLSPMGPLVAQAHVEGYPLDGKHQPYHGYFFHQLKSQGEAAPGGRMSYLTDGRLVKGFALLAYPDKWGSSGVMTFIVAQDGKVYQKNLGDKTSDAVRDVNEYNPDKGWEQVKD